MKQWYLVYCKRGEQPRARMHLENQGVECFYPEIEVEKIVRGKKKKTSEPLFPSYVFVYFDFEKGPTFTTVRSTRGVTDFIRFGSHPTVIDSSLIDELRSFLPEFESTPTNLPKHGDVVQIKSGQFAGIEAIYQESDGEKRSFMLVKMINQDVSMSIDNRDLHLN
ncbi:transcription/translation regulatory transformer protein RfaH [Vibrio sp. RC27]